MQMITAINFPTNMSDEEEDEKEEEDNDKEKRMITAINFLTQFGQKYLRRVI